MGFEQLAKNVQPYSPAWAAEQAGVEEGQIIKAYELMVRATPAVIVHPGRHVTGYSEADTQRAGGRPYAAHYRAVLGRLAGPIVRSKRLHARTIHPPDTPDLPDHVDKAAKRFPFAQEVTTTGIRETTCTADPYPIKGWYVHGSNLIQSLSNQKETIEAIQNLDMLIVSDIQPTEITDWADVILPADTYFERYDDLKRGGNLRPYIAIPQPVVKSPYDTTPSVAYRQRARR